MTVNFVELGGALIKLPEDSSLRETLDTYDQLAHPNMSTNNTGYNDHVFSVQDGFESEEGFLHTLAMEINSQNAVLPIQLAALADAIRQVSHVRNFLSRINNIVQDDSSRVTHSSWRGTIITVSNQTFDELNICTSDENDSAYHRYFFDSSSHAVFRSKQLFQGFGAITEDWIYTIMERDLLREYNGSFIVSAFEYLDIIINNEIIDIVNQIIPDSSDGVSSFDYPIRIESQNHTCMVVPHGRGGAFQYGIRIFR